MNFLRQIIFSFTGCQFNPNHPFCQRNFVASPENVAQSPAIWATVAQHLPWRQPKILAPSNFPQMIGWGTQLNYRDAFSCNVMNWVARQIKHSQRQFRWRDCNTDALYGHQGGTYRRMESKRPPGEKRICDLNRRNCQSNIWRHRRVFFFTKPINNAKLPQQTKTEKQLTKNWSEVWTRKPILKKSQIM